MAAAILTLSVEVVGVSVRLGGRREGVEINSDWERGGPSGVFADFEFRVTLTTRRLFVSPRRIRDVSYSDGVTAVIVFGLRRVYSTPCRVM